MDLHSATSAILSAVIFNAIIIPLLIPIAPEGGPIPARGGSLLRRNLLIWGLGGVILPFVGIKLIDLLLVALGLIQLKHTPGNGNGKTIMRHLHANLWLLLFTLALCTVMYPLILWGIGRTAFPSNARGGLVDKNGRLTTSEKDAVGSRLIAQPFTGEEYFQPRPSAASYNAAASGASNLGEQLPVADRVARQLGPIVKYRSGVSKGQLIGSDIEAWFQENQFRGQPGIVAQWAKQHPTLASQTG